MGPQDLTALREKYEEMLRLRLAADAGAGGDPRRAMAALAARFPGALREIDDLPLETIRSRIQELERGERGGPVALWMEATNLFHGLTRGALCAKKWLGGRKAVDAATREAFEREAGTLCFAGDALPWGDDLARLASPPRGRVTELVYERIGAALAITVTEARFLVFGGSPRRGGEASA